MPGVLGFEVCCVYVEECPQPGAKSQHSVLGKKGGGLDAGSYIDSGKGQDEGKNWTWEGGPWEVQPSWPAGAPGDIAVQTKPQGMHHSST